MSMTGIGISLTINSIFILVVALRLVYLENKVDKLESKIKETNKGK